ncbi:related to Mig1 protein [Ustilago bromivora]|uniref:Related to Mig1 protein n=1 Tax=Ustilago bromivora TaxID=307758 RepID=A0A1K0G5E9_9BASI|nr:related to Mig1 protein [Ustilago bromivora]
MLHSAVGELIPRHVSHHLFARQDISDQCVVNLASNYNEYKNKCEVGNEAKHPCFTHWAGDLNGALVCGLVDPLNIKKNLLIKNDHMTDFTIKDPTKSFVIKYPELRAELLYFNYDPHTGCKDITLKRGGDEAWRIWVSDEDGNGRGIDTKNYAETTKRLCSKWIHIHVKRDG